MLDLAAYSGLFLTSFIAGTLLPFLPGSSELAMGGLLAARVGEPAALVSIATLGTVAGASVNYVVGRNIARLSTWRRFPVSQERLDEASIWFQRYGVVIILLCWLPTLGDAITVVSGLLKAKFVLFLAFVAIGRLFGHLLMAGGVNVLII